MGNAEYMGRRRRTAKRKTTTRKAKEEKVEEMASYGIFLRLAFLCFFIVRFADSYGYNRGYNPYNRGYNPYNRGYYNRGYNPYNKAGADDRGVTMDTTPTTGATIHTTGATIHTTGGAMDTRSTKLWIQQRIQQLQRIKQGYKCKCSCGGGDT